MTDQQPVETQPNEGGLRFDRRFAGLGVPRLQRSSGTSDATEFARRNGLLTRIAASGLYELMQAFADGEVSIDDLLRFERDENLRNGLTELRAARERASVPARPAPAKRPAISVAPRIIAKRENVTATAPIETAPARESKPAVPVAPVEQRAATLNTDTELPPHLSTIPNAPSSVGTESQAADASWSDESLNEDFSVPLWSTFQDTVLPGMLEVSAHTRRRYETSIRTLRQKLSAFGASEAQFEVLAGISPNQWDALALARSRGLEVAVLRSGIHLSLAKQRLLLTARNLKMPVDVFHDVMGLSSEQWEVLESLADLPITWDLIELLDQAPPEDRAALRRAAATLGPNAALSALGRVTMGEWHALSRCWGASATDWNHMRRALSKCLSTYIGTDRHLFRQLVIDRLPLLTENKRVPDITLELLAKVVDELPHTIKFFPWFLVLTGCRIGEYLRLEPEHLKANVHTIAVPGTKTAGSVRSVFVQPDVWWLIEASVPCYLQYGQLRLQWRAACERVGVRGVTIHDLRHVCGQTAADGGARIESIQAQLGHATAEMALRYARRRELKDTSEKLGHMVVPHLPPADRRP